MKLVHMKSGEVVVVDHDIVPDGFKKPEDIATDEWLGILHIVKNAHLSPSAKANAKIRALEPMVRSWGKI